ncbi:hypothetical protein MBLNU457_4765t2 [Dothideomycetes sp. NU457]
MSNKKDMRRGDLIVPYTEPAVTKSDTDMQGTISSMLPMAAIFTRNKTAVIFSIQGWLSETPAGKKQGWGDSASTPGYFSVAMAFLALGVCYLNLFIPPVPGSMMGSGSGTEAPAAVPSA